METEGLVAAKQDQVEKLPGPGEVQGVDRDHTGGGGEDQQVAGQREIHVTA